MLRNSFVRRDIEYLRQLGLPVKEWPSFPHKGTGFASNRLRELLGGFFAIWRSSHVISWFSDYHSFFLLFWAKLLQRPSVVIVGGFDAVAAPHLNYGAFLRANLRRWVIRQNYRMASQIWVVDKSLAEGCPVAHEQNEVRSGLLNWMPELAPKIHTVPTGYDVEFWKPQGPKQPKTVLTVGLFTDLRVAERKGIPYVLELANHWPDYSFTIVGDTNGILQKHYELPKNVTVLNLATQDDLLYLFQQHQYYVQFSCIEGLPNVLCEAMLCGCIPIGNPVFGIPTAIGDCGVLVDVRKLASLQSSIKEQLSGMDSASARARIQQFFGAEKRVEKIKNFIQLK